jgi:aminopeptidase N
MKTLVCILLLIATLSYSQSPTPAPVIDINHYRFQLQLNDSTDVITGKADITLTLKQAAQAIELQLKNWSPQGKGMRIEQLALNGTKHNFTHQHDRINIPLTAKHPVGTQLKLTVEYKGIPSDGLIIGKNRFGDRTFFGDNWPNRAHCWLPTIDHPADKASVEFIVIAPSHYDVIGNGVRVEESYLNNKQKLTHWREDINIPTKVMVIGAARFAVQYAGAVGNIPVEHWVYPQNRLEGFYDYSAALSILDFFNSHIGPYPYKKLANVQSKTRYGGMENASNIFYNEDYVNGKADRNELIAHEIAHQWFGNSASEKEWSHVWLSEGFATYFAHLYDEYTLGVEKRKVDMKKDRDEVVKYFKDHPLPVVNNAFHDPMELLNVNSYQKGSWVLHMLRQEVGNENFWKGIRQYYTQYQHSNALTEDLEKVMETVSGLNLDQFFKQWVYKAGHPILKSDWNYDPATKVLQISIDQTQSSSLFTFPLEIGILEETNDGYRVEKVKISQSSEKFTFSGVNKPVRVVLDPYINLLFEGK